MATKNYTLSEAVAIIAEGKDLEAITDLGKKFPILSIKIAKLTTMAKDEFVDFMSYMPEYLTIKKVNNVVKTTDEEKEHKVEEQKETKKRGRKPKQKVEAVPTEEPNEVEKYEEMTAPDLFKLCKSRGIKTIPKKPARFYIDLLEKMINLNQLKKK